MKFPQPSPGIDPVIENVGGDKGFVQQLQLFIRRFGIALGEGGKSR